MAMSAAAGAAARDFQVRAQLGEQIADLLGRADGRSRFEDHHIAGLQHVAMLVAACST
jgi:hypothetical protein